MSTPRTRSEYTRSGVRRSGDDYQDIVALDVLVEMLRHPSRYRACQVEADDVGALDDVLVIRANGEYSGRQVKFSAHPDEDADPWSWSVLLRQETGKAGQELPSLPQKWSGALELLQSGGPVHDAGVYSNRRPADDLAAALAGRRKVDFNRVIDAGTRAEIVRQLGSEEIAGSFFSEFRFNLDWPGLSDLEEGVSRRFYQLGGSKSGWLALKEELRRWVRKRDLPAPDGKITLDAIRTAAGWNRLEALPEAFPIPDDYALPTEDFDRQFQAKIASAPGDCVAAPHYTGAWVQIEPVRHGYSRQLKQDLEGYQNNPRYRDKIQDFPESGY